MENLSKNQHKQTDWMHQVGMGILISAFLICMVYALLSETKIIKDISYVPKNPNNNYKHENSANSENDNSSASKYDIDIVGTWVQEGVLRPDGTWLKDGKYRGFYITKNSDYGFGDGELKYEFQQFGVEHPTREGQAMYNKNDGYLNILPIAHSTANAFSFQYNYSTHQFEYRVSTGIAMFSKID